MKTDKKRIELLLLMDKAGLIDVPTKANTFAMKAMKKRGLDDKVKLVGAITDCQYGRSNLLLEPRIGPVKVAEMCWWAVYGKNEAPNVKLTGAREDSCKDQTTPAGRPG